MESTRLTRQTGAIALVGAVMGAVVSVLINAAYSKHIDGAGLQVPFWQPGLEQAAQPLLSFASPEVVYPLYGRLALLVFAAFAAGLYGLYASLRSQFAGKPPRLLVWGYRLAMTGFILSILGNVGDYWIPVGEFLDFLSFLGGTILGLLLIASGSILLGVSGLRSGLFPRSVTWALIVWLPLTIVLFLIGMGNLPAAPLLALCLTWAIVGASMVRPEGKIRMFNKQANL